MTRASIKFLSVAFIAALPMLASAQLTGNVSLTSNYKFRGQDQDTGKVSAFKPAFPTFAPVLTGTSTGTLKPSNQQPSNPLTSNPQTI